jgi:hypothetical protein
MKMSKSLLAIAICAASYTAHANWTCQVVNNYKQQTWTGIGPTRAIALENAMKFCSNHSQFVKNCQATQCSQQ